MYNDIVKDHFVQPRNTGEIDRPDAVGSAKNTSDGDRVQLHFRLEGGVIRDVRMKVMGCVAAIASASMLTEMVKGMTIDEALTISKESVAEKLGGLPEKKLKCSLTCVDALRSALGGRKA